MSKEIFRSQKMYIQHVISKVKPVGRGVWQVPLPQQKKGLILVSYLIYICTVYIPKLGPLGPPLHVEKFMVGWWWEMVVLGV